MKNFIRKLFSKKTKEKIIIDDTWNNVEDFNDWFKNHDNAIVYANAGIYLRTDKLSLGQLYGYYTCKNNLKFSIDEIQNYVDENYYLQSYEFLRDIRTNWLEQLR